MLSTNAKVNIAMVAIAVMSIPTFIGAVVSGITNPAPSDRDRGPVRVINTPPEDRPTPKVPKRRAHKPHSNSGKHDPLKEKRKP